MKTDSQIQSKKITFGQEPFVLTNELIKNNSIDETLSKYYSEATEEHKKKLLASTVVNVNTEFNNANERKSLRTVDRLEIANRIIKTYSMLKKYKGIFHAQLFSAMDDYLKACNDTGYKII